MSDETEAKLVKHPDSAADEIERLSAGKEEAFQWADKFKARAEAAEARLAEAAQFVPDLIDIAVTRSDQYKSPVIKIAENWLSTVREPPSEG